jgi:exopolysaccharide biosynthesis polyprenyl glycosylphosphotransferase
VATAHTPAQALADAHPRSATAPHEDGRRRDARRRRFLALADLAAGGAFCVALALEDVPAGAVLMSVLLLPLWPVLAKLYGLYDRDHRAFHATTGDELGRLAGWAVMGTAVIGAASVVVGGDSLDVEKLLWPLVTVGVAAVGFRACVRVGWRAHTPPERTLVVGTDPLAASVRRKLELLPQLHQEIVESWSLARLEDAVARDALPPGLDRLIVASTALDEARLNMLVGACRRSGMKLSVIPPVPALLGSAAQLSRAGDLPVLDYNTWDASRSTLALKRTLDVVLGLLALALAAPLLALIAAAIAIDSRGPILFRQRRAGLGGREFRMLKLRTMVANAEELLPQLVDVDRLADPVFKLRNDPRMTRVGRLLRRFSLDELPQLVNVIRGDMSLVGPRPEQVELVARYGADHDVRFRVRPGMTGPMQVYGRGHLTLDERLTVERDYVENLSLRRDLHLLALTLPAVVAGRGAF